MWWMLVTAVALATTCPEEPVQQLQRAADEIEQAFIELDDDGFDRAHEAFQEALPCVREPLALRDVMSLHRSAAIAAFIDGDTVGSRKSWGAVRALNPSWEPSARLAPPGHLLRGLFDSAPTSDEVVELERAPRGGWMIDGRMASAVPRDRAFVVQALDGEGVVLFTGYGRSVAEIPALDLVRPGVSPEARRMRIIGTAVGGALLLGAVAGAVLHFDARSRLDQVPYDKVDATRTRGNVAGWSAIGAGTAAVAVATVGWAVRW